MSTIIVASLFLGLLVALIFLWILFLRVGLRWAKVQDVTMRRVAFAAILLFALHIALIIVSYLVSPSDPAPALIFGIAKLVAGVLIPCFVIIKVFKASFDASCANHRNCILISNLPPIPHRGIPYPNERDGAHAVGKPLARHMCGMWKSRFLLTASSAVRFAG
jgi:hypothetical protein